VPLVGATFYVQALVRTPNLADARFTMCWRRSCGTPGCRSMPLVLSHMEVGNALGLAGGTAARALSHSRHIFAFREDVAAVERRKS
jgi:hypothetical protein